MPGCFPMVPWAGRIRAGLLNVDGKTYELPIGRLVLATPGRWDDCFHLKSSPVLSWPGALDLTLTPSTGWWVAFDQPADTVCVEPQTAPPDAFDHPALQPTSAWPRNLWMEITAGGH